MIDKYVNMCYAGAVVKFKKGGTIDNLVDQITRVMTEGDKQLAKDVVNQIVIKMAKNL